METAVLDQSVHDRVNSITLPSLARRIGNTPLLRLTKVTDHLPPTVSVWAKAEFLNPGGSVKDRAGLRMLLDGIEAGVLGNGRTLIDATSGNTGIAYAMLGASFGIPVQLAIPSNASPERQRILKAFGAKLILTDPLEGTDGARQIVKEIVQASPEAYFYPDQYNNEANWKAHFDGTGAEILKQTAHRITHFVAALGTTGTFTGTARRLKQFERRIQCVAVQPNGPLHGMEGVKHLATAVVPGIYDPHLADLTATCTTEEAQEMTRRLALDEGLLVGISSGANVAASIRLAESLEKATIVTVLCDTGTRYLSDPFWMEA